MNDLTKISQKALCIFVKRAIARGDLHANLTYAELLDLDNALALDALPRLMGDGRPARHAVEVGQASCLSSVPVRVRPCSSVLEVDHV